ncbi:MAG: ankyrin repeat domain-containing protein [Myxococcales bacterium]|nr:ankyrin repeat domain-containing protein [Myxococcales bacterium]
MSAAATKELFQAVSDYPFYGWKDDAAKAERCLARMKEALTAGANWKALLGPGQRDAAFSAATSGDERPLALLFEAGVPWDHKLANEGTLLHRAASFGRVAIVKLLVAKGIPVDAKTQSGRTPLDEARAWKHGKDAVPLLTRLTKAAAKQSKGKPLLAAAGDLDKKAFLLARKRLLAARAFSPSVDRALARAASAFFAATSSGTTEALLLELAGQEQDDVLAAGLRVAAAATTRRPVKMSHAAGDAYLVHVGDLVVDGSCDARVLVVTGDLTVKGRLTNFEGRVICVGGNVKAKAIFTEGPFVVRGDVKATACFVASYNDYAATIGGKLETKIALVDDHVTTVGKWAATTRYRSRRAVTPADLAKLNAARR